MKELIGIDYSELENQIWKVEELVRIVNSFTERLNKIGRKITADDIIKMCISNDEYKKGIYLEELEKICEMFAQDFNEVSKFEYSISHSENMFGKMAASKCTIIYDLCSQVYKLAYWGDNVFLHFIEVNDNIASPKLSYKEDLKEYYSHYAQNDAQNKLTKALKNVQKAINEAMKLGFNCYEVKNFINGTDNEIIYNKVESIN